VSVPFAATAADEAGLEAGGGGCSAGVKGTSGMVARPVSCALPYLLLGQVGPHLHCSGGWGGCGCSQHGGIVRDPDMHGWGCAWLGQQLCGRAGASRSGETRYVQVTWTCLKQCRRLVVCGLNVGMVVSWATQVCGWCLGGWGGGWGHGVLGADVGLCVGREHALCSMKGGVRRVPGM
jgi:hypothetical protein